MILSRQSTIFVYKFLRHRRNSSGHLSECAAQREHIFFRQSNFLPWSCAGGFESCVDRQDLTFPMVL